MKTLLFYFLLTLVASSVATANDYMPVLDTDDDIMLDGSYYVVPAFKGQGGGVTFFPRGGKFCPLDIVQESSESNKGFPIKFTNWKSKFVFVPLLENLNIEMDVKGTICVESTYWWMDEFDKEKRNWLVKAGPKPRKDSAMSFFQIQKSENYECYKFVFCIGDLRVDRENCIDIGIRVDEKGVRRLAFSAIPFWVKFKKGNVTTEEWSMIM